MAHVVLAEDNPITALVLRIRLARAGHTVTVVEHRDMVATAVQVYPPDLILLHAWLPDPDSLAVAQQLKADPQARAIPIVMLTDQTDPQWLHAVRSGGADAVVTTLLDHDALIQVIDMLLARAPARFPADRGQQIRSSA